MIGAFGSFDDALSTHETLVQRAQTTIIVDSFFCSLEFALILIGLSRHFSMSQEDEHAENETLLTAVSPAVSGLSASDANRQTP